MKVFEREHAAAQAAGDVKTATAIGAELEDARLEQLRDDPDLAGPGEIKRLEEGAEVRELIADNDLDPSEVRPSAGPDGEPVIGREAVEQHVEQNGGASGDSSDDSPTFSSPSAEKAFDALDADDQERVKATGSGGRITVADVEKVS